MSEKKGFLQIPRSLYADSRWIKKPLSHRSVYNYIHEKTLYADYEFELGKTLIKLKRGQFAFTYRRLTKEYNETIPQKDRISVSTMERIIKGFEEDGFYSLKGENEAGRGVGQVAGQVVGQECTILTQIYPGVYNDFDKIRDTGCGTPYFSDAGHPSIYIKEERERKRNKNKTHTPTPQTESVCVFSNNSFSSKFSGEWVKNAELVFPETKGKIGTTALPMLVEKYQIPEIDILSLIRDHGIERINYAISELNETNDEKLVTKHKLPGQDNICYVVLPQGIAWIKDKAASYNLQADTNTEKSKPEKYQRLAAYLHRKVMEYTDSSSEIDLISWAIFLEKITKQHDVDEAFVVESIDYVAQSSFWPLRVKDAQDLLKHFETIKHQIKTEKAQKKGKNHAEPTKTAEPKFTGKRTRTIGLVGTIPQ